MKLNPRLETALDILKSQLETGEQKTASRSFSRLFDVGCDHAHLCIEAINRGLTDLALAMDVRRGPLDIAQGNIQEAGLSDRISLLLSDGLDAVTVEENDAVSILGMGGLEIGDIVSRVNWPAQSTIVMQPMRSLPELRMRLAAMGLRIEREELCWQRGKLYVFFLVKHTLMPIIMSPEDAIIGPYWYDHWHKHKLWPVQRDNLLRILALKQQAEDYDKALDAASKKLRQMN